MEGEMDEKKLVLTTEWKNGDKVKRGNKDEYENK
jgi:hypothetical protein